MPRLKWIFIPTRSKHLSHTRTRTTKPHDFTRVGSNSITTGNQILNILMGKRNRVLSASLEACRMCAVCCDASLNNGRICRKYVVNRGCQIIFLPTEYALLPIASCSRIEAVVEWRPKCTPHSYVIPTSDKIKYAPQRNRISIFTDTFPSNWIYGRCTVAHVRVRNDRSKCPLNLLNQKIWHMVTWARWPMDVFWFCGSPFGI